MRRRLSLWVVKENQERLYQDIERLFAPDKPKPGFGKIATDFLQAETVTRDMDALRNVRSKPAPCSTIMSIGPGWDKSIGWSAISPGYARGK